MSNKGPSLKETFLTPIIANNPVMIQVLGICSSLAVTSSTVSYTHLTLPKNSRV